MRLWPILLLGLALGCGKTARPTSATSPATPPLFGVQAPDEPADVVAVSAAALPRDVNPQAPLLLDAPRLTPATQQSADQPNIFAPKAAEGPLVIHDAVERRLTVIGSYEGLPTLTDIRQDTVDGRVSVSERPVDLPWVELQSGGPDRARGKGR